MRGDLYLRKPGKDALVLRIIYSVAARHQNAKWKREEMTATIYFLLGAIHYSGSGATPPRATMSRSPTLRQIERASSGNRSVGRRNRTSFRPMYSKVK